MKANLTTNTKGEIDEVYSTENGLDLAEEKEGCEGWWQINKTLRVQVMYTRTSHSSCTWIIAEIQ